MGNMINIPLKVTSLTIHFSSELCLEISWKSLKCSPFRVCKQLCSFSNWYWTQLLHSQQKNLFMSLQLWDSPISYNCIFFVSNQMVYWIMVSFAHQVMVENSDFTPSQVGCLFTFLARQLAKPDNTLFVNRTLFDQVSVFNSES